MTLSQTVQTAKDMEVDPRFAAMARLRFLKPRIAEMERELWSTQKDAAFRKNPTEKALLLSIAKDTETTLRGMRSEADALLRYVNGKLEFRNSGKTRRIDPEMIERAKNYPMEVLLDQKPKGPGKVVCCPFHNDKAASASVKLNRLICFAGCKPKDGKKGWDTITLLMERDGMSFREAVMALQ